MLNLASAYLLNLIVNSLLGFVMLTAIVRLIVLALRPGSPRVRLWLHSLPMLKLAIDPFLYRFDRWALAQGMDPWNAEAGTRTLGIWVGQNGLSFCGVGMSLESGETFSLADLLITALPPGFSSSLVVGFLGLSLLQLARVLRRILAARACAEQAQTPLCYGWLWPVWRVPSSCLLGLSDLQAAAITRHEKQHARWRDPLLLAVLEALRALYWWLPLGSSIARIRLEQEHDCDQAALVACSGPDYADALLAIKRGPSRAFCVEAQHALGLRIDRILCPSRRTPSRWRTRLCFLLGLLFLGARFWVF